MSSLVRNPFTRLPFVLAPQRARVFHASSRAAAAAAAAAPGNAGKEGATKHTTESYAKDVDETPPDDSSIYRVDPDSDNVQKPYEPPSGQWSRAGVEAAEYKNVNAAYTTEGGPGLRYGGRKEYAKEKGPETSKADEGPEGKSSRGRK